MIPEPGTEYGPCVPTCEHIDCAHNRTLAATPCYVCSQPIGYGVRYVQRDGWKALAHDACLDRQGDHIDGIRTAFLALP